MLLNFFTFLIFFLILSFTYLYLMYGLNKIKIKSNYYVTDYKNVI
jgi:hypothetical protein